MLSLLALALLATSVTAVPLEARQEAARTSAPAKSYKLNGYSRWAYKGCYEDQNDRRTVANLVRAEKWTVKSCLDAVRAAKYSVGALEIGGECWGSDEIRDGAKKLDASKCAQKCNDDNAYECGGVHAVDVYVYKSKPKPWHRKYEYVGCFSDQNDKRTLANIYNQGVQGSWNVDSCLAANMAAGNTYAGLEVGGECWGADTISAPGHPIDQSHCSYDCNDNHEQSCGGSHALDVYKARW